VTFDDDPLRILRAVRFTITKGFTMDPRIAIAIENYNYPEKMKVVSSERIREELFKCFKENTLVTINTLNEFQLLKNYIFTQTDLWLKPTNEK
jgi:tRNA nucleotidyltransferase/poly(A) polymerase